MGYNKYKNTDKKMSTIIKKNVRQVFKVSHTQKNHSSWQLGLFRGWYSIRCHGDGGDGEEEGGGGDGEEEGGGGDGEADGDHGDGDHGDGRESGAPSRYVQRLPHDEGGLQLHNGRERLPVQRKKVHDTH